MRSRLIFQILEGKMKQQKIILILSIHFMEAIPNPSVLFILRNQKKQNCYFISQLIAQTHENHHSYGYQEEINLLHLEYKIGINLLAIRNLSMPHYPNEIEYSEKYTDAYYQYRHVVLPKEIYKKIANKGKLLNEQEWRSLGIQQSRGWTHYEIHKPQPHILLFRRPKGTDPLTGFPPNGYVAPPDEHW